jgi:N-acetyl-anhydromuramyl-L-alanine amidase AmpD
MATSAGFQFDLPSAGRPAPFQLFEQLYPGVQEHWEASTSKRVFDPVFGVTTMVIHATAGGGSESAMSVMKAGQASWHWVVPDESEAQHGQLVWVCAPEARAAWHVDQSCSHPKVGGGKTKVNHFSLAVNIVSRRAGNGPRPFSDWQVFAVAEIIRHCWAKYPNLKHIVSHARLDPARSDPGGNSAWNKLRGLVVNTAPAKILPLVAKATPMSLLPKARTAALCCG